MTDEERTRRAASRFSVEPVGDDTGPSIDTDTTDHDDEPEGDGDVEASTESSTTTTTTQDAGDGEAEDDWVRIQFRVPEQQRTDWNDIGYAKFSIEARERGIEGLERREMQRAAVKALLDNPEIWVEAAEELHD